MENWGSLVVFVGLVGGVAALGGQWGAKDWYRTLKKPAWTPPGWAFPIAWSILYVLIALAGWWVWLAEPSDSRDLALFLWIVQLIANAAWSYVFFALKRTGRALGVLALIWLPSLGFIILTRDFEPRAAIAFAPYLFWLTYAASVNAGVVALNR